MYLYRNREEQGVKRTGPACVFRRRDRIKNEQNYKPGSVFDSHLSRRTVASTLQPPLGSGRANHALPSTVLLRIEFTAMGTLEPSGALLPHLSTLTSPAQAPYPLLRCKQQSAVTPLRLLSPQKLRFCRGPNGEPRRYISVALFLRSLWAGVTRYPCPVEPGLSS